MFKTEKIELRNSGVVNNLLLNYLEKDEKLKEFYGHYPDKKGFSELLNTQPYSDFNRKLLSEIVLKQNLLVVNTSDASITNAKRLAEPNVFTITTGHQLCLFTGPLYFLYKIFSAINLAEELTNEFPGKEFIPVYWMASEDHDFEEINNFNLFGKTVKWTSEQAGSVGDFKTNELNELLPQLKEIFGTHQHTEYLITLFENAYLKHKTLADATRFLVNELFGKYGLLIVDGNDVEFKQLFKAQFKKDIFENQSYNCVSESIKKLAELGYEAQVNPRLINCFYTEEGSRLRIEKTGDSYNLVGGSKTFTETELREVIENNPEKISPNVVLRPLYQQAILPNIAYVGGPGELAYWLEYKSMFEKYNLFFPLLVPRNFLMVLDKSTKSKIQKLNFENQDFFKPENTLIQEFQIKANAVFELNEVKEKLTSIYTEITEKISLVDKSLSGSVSAELQKSFNGLDMLSGKANKALKQRLDTEINQIKGVKQKLFPTGVPQERYENFSTFYLKFGAEFLTEIKSNIQVFDSSLKLLIED